MIDEERMVGDVFLEKPIEINGKLFVSTVDKPVFEPITCSTEPYVSPVVKAFLDMEKQHVSKKRGLKRNRGGYPRG